MSFTEQYHNEDLDRYWSDVCEASKEAGFKSMPYRSDVAEAFNSGTSIQDYVNESL